MKAETLYQRLVASSNVPVTETTDIWLPGLFFKEGGIEPRVYIKESLKPLEKLQVLLHEYTHYLHMEKFYEQENRAESEIIAQSVVFLVLREFGIYSNDKPVLEEFTQDKDRKEHLSAKIQRICNEILSTVK